MAGTPERENFPRLGHPMLSWSSQPLLEVTPHQSLKGGRFRTGISLSCPLRPSKNILFICYHVSKKNSRSLVEILKICAKASAIAKASARMTCFTTRKQHISPYYIPYTASSAISLLHIRLPTKQYIYYCVAANHGHLLLAILATPVALFQGWQSGSKLIPAPYEKAQAHE